MTFTELQPVLSSLDKADKRRAMAFLASELEKEAIAPAYSLPEGMLSRYHALVERKYSDSLTDDEQFEFDRLSAELDNVDWNSPAEQQLRARETTLHAEQLAILDSIADQLTRLKSV